MYDRIHQTPKPPFKTAFVTILPALVCANGFWNFLQGDMA
jgi:hypothetical protein